MQLFNHFLNFNSGLLSAASQCTNFIGYYGKTTALFARTCRFNRGVQGQQVGLTGNRIDHGNHFTDFVRTRGQMFNCGGGLSNFFRQNIDGIDRPLHSIRTM